MVIGSRLPALLLALLPIIQGAAVLDLINLFHQYEDDILGRGQGVNPEPLETYEEEVEAGKPIEVHGWDDGLKVGQVTAVARWVGQVTVLANKFPVEGGGFIRDAEAQRRPRRPAAILAVNLRATDVETI